MCALFCGKKINVHFFNGPDCNIRLYETEDLSETGLS